MSVIVTSYEGVARRDAARALSCRRVRHPAELVLIHVPTDDEARAWDAALRAEGVVPRLSLAREPTETFIAAMREHADAVHVYVDPAPFDEGAAT